MKENEGRRETDQKMMTDRSNFKKKRKMKTGTRGKRREE